MSASFRSRLLAGDQLVGSYLKTPSMMIAEVLGQTGLDAICIDAEHAPFDRGDIDAVLAAFRAAGMPALVRVPSAAPEQIGNALDCGATGVIVPHVSSVEKAQACVSASHYGEGGRGYAGSTRSAGYGGNTIAVNLADNQANTVVIAQIEDPAALDCIDAIAAVDGIDCLFIGMMDLTVALGETSASAATVTQAAEKICAAARKHHRAVGMFIPNPDDAGFWRERGVSLFLLGSDHAFIKQGAANLCDRARA